MIASAAGHAYSVPSVVQQRVVADDIVERLQDRIARGVEAVLAHPLDFADPHRHARQLGRERVDLDAEHVLRADAGKLAAKPQRFALGVDAMLDVLQRLQAEIEEVAGAAGRIENAELLQALQERRPSATLRD